MLTTIPVEQFKKDCAEGNRVIIDVRTPGEFKGGHIQGAKNIDIMGPSFAGEIEALEKETPYAIYCHSGNRSGHALRFMETLGFTDVIDLEGGVIEWVGEGNKLVTE